MRSTTVTTTTEGTPSTVPPAAKMEAGGGGGGSAFASTVVAAQSLASKVLAAKIEYDLSVKAVEETKEAEQAEGARIVKRILTGALTRRRNCPARSSRHMKT